MHNILSVTWNPTHPLRVLKNYRIRSGRFSELWLCAMESRPVPEPRISAKRHTHHNQDTAMSLGASD